jgi:hypothetical protein
MTEIQLSGPQLQVLQHTLGLSNSKTAYRNYFYAEVGHHDWESLLALENLGLMRRRRDIFSNMVMFQATEAGTALAERSIHA